MSAQQQVRYRGFPATDRDRLPRFIDRFDGALQGRLDGEDRIALAVLHLTNHCPHGRLLALGGSVIDPANRVMLCRRCHEFVTTHPARATEMGLLRHSWEAK